MNCTWWLQLPACDLSLEVLTHTDKACLVTRSGSGKSTLLDILAQRKTVGKIKGEVLVAGQKPTQTFLRRYSGYVEQFDTLIPVLTVYEMLLYTAELKTPRAVGLKVCSAVLVVLVAMNCCNYVLGLIDGGAVTDQGHILTSNPVLPLTEGNSTEV